MARSTSRDPSPPGLLDETLAGTRGVEALRRLAVDPLDHGVRELLTKQVPDWDGSSLRLVRTKYKPGRKLSAYYELSRRGVDAQPVAVIWTNGSAEVLVSPHDPAMPQLAGLHDPAHLTDVLEAMRQRPTDTFTDPRIHTVRYRPGQRHVLWVSQPGHRAVYIKMDRDDSGVRSVPIAAALRDRVADRCPGAGLVEPLGFSANDRAAVWRSAAGAPLWQRFETSRVRLLGRAVRTLHDIPPDDVPSTSAGAGSRDARDEIAATLRAGQHIETLLPTVGSDYRALVDELTAALDLIPTEAPAFNHGDLKADNVLTLGDSAGSGGHPQIRLLDLDRSGPADPALDLGKFVADLRWWSGADEGRVLALVSAFRDGYGECDPARWERAELLASLFQLKLAARRCAVHDPNWEIDVRARVAAAVPVLVREGS